MAEMDCEPTSKEGEGQGKPVVVLLMGAPGSGKSTFCEHVIRSSTRPWVRVCQDTIGNGKAGTKSQCLKSATSALEDGKSVFIDRCNLDREQRAEFVKLGSPQVEMHAVVLDLPAQLCISRSVKRTGHEGNLQGGKAAAVVNRMLQKKELPKLSEGFHESQFAKMIVMFKLPSTRIVHLVILILFHLAHPLSPQITKEKDSCCKQPEDISSSSGNAKEIKGGENIVVHSVDGTVSSKDIPTLAFPSISTADFQFNHEKAADIILEKVEEFVNKVENARLVLVDLSHGSKILSLVRAKAAQRNIDSNKFFTFVGDITRLYSKGGLRCNAIANAANWRLKPGGGGANAAIFSAAGPELEVETKKRAGSLIPGKALVVPLPSISPLFSREGVTHVIHVLGPNMNPQRPNCLNNDYVKGSKVLCEAYTSLFEGFASIINTQGNLLEGSSENLRSELSVSQDHFTGNHIKNVPNHDQKIKRVGVYESETSKKCKGFQDEHEFDCTESKEGKDNLNNEKIGRNMTKTWGSWAQSLYHIAMHPEKHKDNLIEISDDVVVLNDLYPKAQRHLLVLARSEGLDCLADVGGEHLQLLRTMHAVGLKWAEKFLCEDELLVFRLGYHSAPSMRQLHLHVISQDFNSKHLKNKKHWNSFNSAFFRDSVDVIEEITNHGRATIKGEDSRLSMELRCHRCRSAHPNMPRLKSHISNCQASFPPSLLQNDRLVLAPSKSGSEP
ncbi:hypothetical protein AAG906_037195 [Vitis piasezkii]